MHIHMSIKILCTLTLCRNVPLMGMSVLTHQIHMFVSCKKLYTIMFRY